MRQRLLPDWRLDQWMVTVTLTLTHLCNGMCVSLQAPFYPAEAESKGASATQYGLVFGVFELTVFLVSPVVGRLLTRIGVSRAFSGGIMTTGIMCVSFGLLNRVSQLNTFISLSFVIRIVEAVGNSFFLSSSFTLVASQFPSSVSTMFGVVEMSFGVGMILGPTVGGALYQLGGFTLPFTVLGGVLVVQAVLSSFTLPAMKEREEEEENSEEFGLFKALQLPPVMLAVLSVFSGSVAVGALQATLERHLATFSLGPVQVGVIFMLYGFSYAVLNPLWGWLSDIWSSTMVILLGSLLLGLGSLLIGPVPGLGLTPNYYLSVVAITIAGFGLGAQLVAAFAEAQRAAIAQGFPDNVKTYATISSIWTSTFALGAFVGPTVAGGLYDVVGFRWSTLFQVSWNVVVAVMAVLVLMVRRREKQMRSQYQQIQGWDGESSPE